MIVRTINYIQEGHYYRSDGEHNAIGIRGIPGRVEPGIIEDDTWKPALWTPEVREVTIQEGASSCTYLYTVIDPDKVPYGLVLAFVQELTPSTTVATILYSEPGNDLDLEDWETRYYCTYRPGEES